MLLSLKFISEMVFVAKESLCEGLSALLVNPNSQMYFVFVFCIASVRHTYSILKQSNLPI